MPEPSRSASLSEPLGGDLITEAPAEVRYDAVTADVAADELEPEREVHKFGAGFWVAVVFLTTLTTICILAPYLPFIDSPTEIDAQAIREGPTSSHWFGGDDLGRDVFARVMHGGRISLFFGGAAVGLGFIVGGMLGLTAGYFGGRYDSTVVGAMDVMLAFPALVLALALVTFLSEPGTQDASVGVVLLTLTILAVPALARITRAATLTYAQREFVLAARSLGAKDGRIIWREILPNVIPPMASFALVAVAIVIVAEGALSFLGLSVSSPTATWGKLINEGRGSLDEAPHISLLPCAVMFATLLSLNYIGDRLRSRFDVRESGV